MFFAFDFMFVVKSVGRGTSLLRGDEEAYIWGQDGTSSSSGQGRHEEFMAK
jgi:hypothetical protein